MAHAPAQRTLIKVFIFKKNSRGPNINIFDENLREASFYSKEQTQKFKFEILLLKSTIFDPQKSALVFEENPPKKFSSCFGFDSAWKTIDTHMFYWSEFLKMHNKSYWLSKMPFWPFLAVNNVFLCVFKNTYQNNIYATIVLKAKIEKK